MKNSHLVAGFSGIPWSRPEASQRPSPILHEPRLDTSTSFRKEAYTALKRAITAMDIYDQVIVWPLTLPRCGPSLSPHAGRGLG